MNPSDDDLNCLLKAWTVPRSPDSLEVRLRDGYRDRARTRTTAGLLEVSPVTWGTAEGGQRKRSPGVWGRWIAGFLPSAGKFAGVIAGAVVLLAVITRAFPQSLSLIAPRGAIIIYSEFLDYTGDGSSTVSEYRISSVSPIDGETIWSSSFPGDPLRTAAGEVINPVKSIVGRMMQRVVSPLFNHSGRTKYIEATSITVAARIRNNCTPTNMWGQPMIVIDNETVLNYITTVSQFRPEGRGVRFTEWLAPELDCVSLKSTMEKALPDGAFRLASERRVLKVVTNSRTTGAREPNR
jgi:hypothetical protein